MTTKICPKCKMELELSTKNFHKDKTLSHGFSSWCKVCRGKTDSERKKKKRRENGDKVRQKEREYYKKIRKIKIARNTKRNEDFKKKHGIAHTTIHDYIRRIKKKPLLCSICNQEKNLELSSMNHTYTKNPDDWQWVCKECHIKFDNGVENIE